MFERERKGVRNTWGVRGVVCVSHHMHLLYCACGSHACICVSSRSLGRLAGTRWEEMRGDHRGLGRRAEARLMHVCINAVWHLSTRDTHTHPDMPRYCDTVCEHVCRPLWRSSERINWFSLSLLCHAVFCLWHWLPNSEEFSSPSRSSSSIPHPPPTPQFVCDLSLRQVGRLPRMY